MTQQALSVVARTHAAGNALTPEAKTEAGALPFRHVPHNIEAEQALLGAILNQQ